MFDIGILTNITRLFMYKIASRRRGLVGKRCFACIINYDQVMLLKTVVRLPACVALVGHFKIYQKKLLANVLQTNNQIVCDELQEHHWVFVLRIFSAKNEWRFALMISQITNIKNILSAEPLFKVFRTIGLPSDKVTLQ